MSSSNRSSSDPEIEQVNLAEDLVNFHGIAPYYSQAADIVIRFSLGSDVVASEEDWVGLFQTGWGTTEDYLTYVWAPRKSKNRKAASKCQVVFPANQLQALSVADCAFQFLFVSRGSYVAGVSRQFRLTPREADCPRAAGASPCMSLSHASSFSLVGSSASLDTQGFDDLGDSDDDTTSITDTFELKCTSSTSAEDIVICASVKPVTVAAVTDSPPAQKPVTERKPVIAVGKSKRSVIRITRDSSTLTGVFKASVPFAEQLQVMRGHPIVREYMANRERSVTPYVPLYSITKPSQCTQQWPFALRSQQTTESNLVSYKAQSLTPQLSQVTQSSQGPQLETFPCCALCSVANSTMEVYKRQLNLGKTELKDLKMDVFCLRKALNARDEQIRSHKRREVKWKKTENTLEEVVTQMACLKKDISNLLLQNTDLEHEREHIKGELETCEGRLNDSETKFSGAETQLNDILFSLSMKGYNSVVDFSGTKIDLSEVQGASTDIDDWKVYKNKRCGRLLAVIKQQERSIETLQTSLSECRERNDIVQEELSATQQQLLNTRAQFATKEEVLSGVKQVLNASLKREEHTMRMLASAESEMTQFKYDAETREHHLLKELQELREQVQKNQPSAMMAFTNRLVATGLASVPDMCKTNWCAGLCPTNIKSDKSSTPVPLSPKPDRSHTADSISWENEGPVVKQPTVSKKATKRSHKETERKEKSPGKSGRPQHKIFPENCPVCGISFARAVDKRVIDEHLAFHDIYRV